MFIVYSIARCYSSSWDWSPIAYKKAGYIFVAPPYCQTACCMPPEQFILMSLITAFSRGKAKWFRVAVLYVFFESVLICHFMNSLHLKRSFRDILSGVAVRILSLNSSTQLALWKFWVVILWRSLSELALSFYKLSPPEALNQGYTVGSGCAYSVAQ